MSDSSETTPPLDLSSLRLTPNWVSDFGKSAPTKGADYPEEDSRGRRDFSDRGRGGPRPGGFQDRRGAPGGGGRSFDKPRGPGDARRDDRRSGGNAGGGGYRGDRDRRPMGRDDHGSRPPYEQGPRPVPGLNVAVEPEARAMEAMAAMIRTAGKAYSVFDAARLVLASGDRFHVKFTLPPESEVRLFTIPLDGSLWLSREEALGHFLNSEALKEFYLVEEIELEEPKGNFASVAVCGMSGELLGPANHHSYQTSLHKLHRERFSQLPFEEYKRRVRTDSSPEAVQKWKDSQKHGTQWVWQKGTPEEGTEPLRFKTRTEMENHFRKQHAESLVGESSTATVAGNILKNLLAPSLYIHLRRAVDDARKHLLATAQLLCGGFEQQGLKLFKRRGGKLWVSRTRPRVLDTSVVLSDRIARLVETIKVKPGIATKDLIDSVAPAQSPAVEAVAPAEPAVADEGTEATTTEPAADAAHPATQDPTPEQVQALKDLHWLNSEGYVIEYADGVVFIGVTEPPPAKAKPAKQSPPSKEEAAPAEPQGDTEVPRDVATPEAAPTHSEMSTPSDSDEAAAFEEPTSDRAVSPAGDATPEESVAEQATLTTESANHEKLDEPVAEEAPKPEMVEEPVAATSQNGDAAVEPSPEGDDSPTPVAKPAHA